MRPGFHRHARYAFFAFTLLALAGWLVPSFFSAERYRRRLEAELERAFERPVTFSAISFRLLPRPGFSIENAVVHEDPSFGSEPFARVDRIECDLRWRSLWGFRLDFARLSLRHPSLNLVRNPRGEWNVESLLLKSGMSSPAGPPLGTKDALGVLELEAQDARINFKVGADKKPFAITDLRAQINFDPARGLVRYRLSGNPVRTDLSLPTPGPLELAGEWSPGRDLGGPLDATLRTRGAMLYDWFPLVTGRNPEIYGVLDAEVRLTGSLRVIKMQGEGRLSQLHRWELRPSSDPMPCTLRFRGEFDRTRGRAFLESLEASFAGSHLRVSGSVDKIPASPELDLVLALERSRVEDLLALGRRFWEGFGTFGVSGRIDGLLTVHGPWAERRYSGFAAAREVRLSTPSEVFSVSEVFLKIDDRGARLSPVKVALAPRVELVAEGSVHRPAPYGAVYRPIPERASRREADLPRYELALLARTVPLEELVRFGRAVGVRVAPGVEAQGLASATLRLSGPAWPPARPTLAGRVELRGARLLVPGLTEPLNIPRARIQLNDDQVVIEPVVAVIGTSVFTGRFERRGDRKQPWRFDVWANRLNLQEGAMWFDVLGHRPPLELLARLPGLSSFGARRLAASNLFSAMNARGDFASSTLTYRSLTLRDFASSVEISGRVVRVDGASFRILGGLGQGRAAVDLTFAPAQVTADIALAGAKLHTLTPRLPVVLRKIRGSMSGTGHFETRGLTRQEMSAGLQGEGSVRLRNISLGSFDPLDVLARQAPWGPLEPARSELGVPLMDVDLEVRDGRVILKEVPLELAGARLKLGGSYRFDGTWDLDVSADLRNVARRWLVTGDGAPSSSRQVKLRVTGPLDKLAAVPEPQVSRASR